ncbi:hypothetical protein L249_2332 [Ophiocordyceps polyrhachis-furcata BCC 54312]|uniref:Phytocyanin domain-containing protein n=1 Tax=Ophiocordyceps polyrhachis-furcata BCC 54312 TaxID=1330021 RepID=A0A367LNY2_9HYPO|nr:hypothetical protein L249_2332 [Ophiocordyceps polyrhachis-furcata BCC 54312]
MKHTNRMLLAMCGSLLAGLASAETRSVTIKVGNQGQAEVVSGNQSSTTNGGGRQGNNNAAAGGPQEFIIMSGGGADMYAPNFINAAVGSKVTVQFNTGNHTITEGFAEEACKPLQAKDPKALHSGHIPFALGQNTVGTFTFSVNDTQCRYYYCATGPHCMRAQVMTINCSPEEFTKYLKLATASKENIDGNTVQGGVVGSISLEEATFVPLTAENGAKPPPAPEPEKKAENPAAGGGGSGKGEEEEEEEEEKEKEKEAGGG